MIDYHAFSSDDLVNWRDQGVIIHSDSLSWAPRLYAPGARSRDGKYYLYMPNQGSAIGVAVCDNPGGPFVDARGTPLITGQTPNVGGVEWIFDPTCFIDDGQACLLPRASPSRRESASTSTAKSHSKDQMPIILGGGACGRLLQGHHIRSNVSSFRVVMALLHALGLEQNIPSLGVGGWTATEPLGDLLI